MRMLLEILLTMDSSVVLLNSGHQSNKNSSTTFKTIELDGGGAIDIITPPTLANKYIGRIGNLFHVKSILDEIIATHEKPKLAWFYNGYAFEMLAAKYLKSEHGVKTILEFEDWHFARNRGMNPKPFLDWLCWRAAMRKIDYGFAVNMYLKNKLTTFGMPAILLPGIVSESVAELALKCPPFDKEYITVGYFGGLSVEKGASTILSLAHRTSDNIRFVVTGSGPLQSEFSKMSNIIPHRFSFLGAVSEQDLVIAMSQTDLVVNAHHINSGIFPFKIVEALASGRMLVSTELPMLGYETFTDAIQFYSGNIEQLLEIVSNSVSIYRKKESVIRRVAGVLRESYGKLGLQQSIRKVINEIVA